MVTYVRVNVYSASLHEILTLLHLSAGSSPVVMRRKMQRERQTGTVCPCILWDEYTVGRFLIE